MEDSITVDFTKPVLDLTNENITTLDVDTESERVKAAIFSQNPVDDLGFLVRFPELSLVHADSTQISTLAAVPVERLPRLQYLILRLNQLSSFEGLGENDSLETLDVSYNDLQPGCEETVAAAFQSLKRVCFGFPTAGPLNTQLLSCSRTNVNTLSLFRRLFVDRFYDDAQVRLADAGQCELAGVLFTFATRGPRLSIDVKRTSDAPTRNHKLILTAYTAITGFEVVETFQQLLRLAQLAEGSRDFNLAQMCAYEQLEYPTQQTNLNRNDQQAFRLYDQMLEQQLTLLTNYCIITVEMERQIGVVVFDRRSYQCVDFARTQADISKQIALKDGLKLRVSRAGLDLTMGSNQRLYQRTNQQDDFYTPKQRSRTITQTQKQGGIYDKIFNSKVQYYEKRFDEAVDLSVASEEVDDNLSIGTASEDTASQHGKTTDGAQYAGTAESKQTPVWQLQPKARGQTQNGGDEYLDIKVVNDNNSILVQSSPAIGQQQHAMQSALEHGTTGLYGIEYSQSVEKPPLIQLENMELFQELNVLTTAGSSSITIYASTLTHQEIISELQQLVSSLSIQVSPEEALTRIINDFNAAPRPPVDYQGNLYISLLLNGQIPFKIQLRKLAEGSSFYLDRSCKGRHIYCQVDGKGYMSPREIFYKPRLTRVQLTNDEDVLIVKVIEDINGQERTCLSDGILYSFYRNQRLIGQNSLGYLNLTENNIEVDGLFKAVASIMENGAIISELESQPLYLEVE